MRGEGWAIEGEARVARAQAVCCHVSLCCECDGAAMEIAFHFS